ncbi:hypothetical protein ACQCSX_04355 [Pseudarthrobacter sp. P1]|uniref:hypothetical protein n=1 Tax=Pseudarthrobacter sp. P1 TaxID=3418418 RepID=UPI003CEF1B8E
MAMDPGTILRVDGESGARYRRQPVLDEAGVVAWELEAPAALAGPVVTVSARALQGEKHVTLEQLANLVDAARKSGMPGTSPVAGLVTFRGMVKEITIRNP